MRIKHEIRKMFWKAGYDLSRFSPEFHPLAKRKKMLALYGIDTVLDIGANSGQFAKQLKNDLGYKKKLLSFEPLGSAFELLKLSAENDPDWDVFNFGFGDLDEKKEINVSENSLSSSILDILPLHVKSAPESTYTGTETIELRKLDSVFSNLCSPTSKIYMKVDTQGFESKVLEGADNSLQSIDTVQLEMSLMPLYSGELLFNELCNIMIEKGYNLVGIEPGFSDPKTGQVLQADGIFHRFDSDDNVV